MQVITTEATEDEYNRLWATNVAGTFNFTKRVAPLINEGERRYQHHDGRVVGAGRQFTCRARAR